MGETEIKLDALIAYALLENNFKVITHVPGFGGTQVFNHFENSKIKPKLCLNEEPAFSIATGASIYGSRAATLVKTHGLAKMSNAVCSTLSVGANAANLIFAFDDTTGKSSDNIFNAKKLILGLEIPFIEIATNPYQDIKDSIELSENLKLPVVVYVDCEKLGLSFNVDVLQARNNFSSFKKKPLQYIACPPLSNLQLKVFENKKNKGIVLEDLDLPEVLMNMPDNLPPALRITYNSYAPFFQAFSGMNVNFVSGDAGTSSLYAFHKEQFVDVCTYMGGAPGMALGAFMAGAKKSWAVSGDFSFLAAGILGLNEIVSANAAIKLVIFNNGIAGATGGQKVPSSVMAKFINSYKEDIHEINNKMSKDVLHKELEKINESNKLEIVIFTVH